MDLPMFVIQECEEEFVESKIANITTESQNVPLSISITENSERDEEKVNDNSKNENITEYLIDVNTLQTDELCHTIERTLKQISELDANDPQQCLVIQRLKDYLIQQIERLQNISKAIENLNQMQETAENLPKHPKTGLPSMAAVEIALREHCFFSSHIHSYGILLIEICDYKKISQNQSSIHSEQLLISIINKIKQFDHQHILFQLNVDHIILLLYVRNEYELLSIGYKLLDICKLKYDIMDEMICSTISIGVSMYDEKQESFRFSDWYKSVFAGLEKANTMGVNKCCVYKKDDILKVSNDIIGHSPMVRDENIGHVAHRSSLIRISNNSLNGKLHGKQLTKQEIRYSIKLYDKLLSIKDKYSACASDMNIVAISVCRNLCLKGANYNFRHPKCNGNTLLIFVCLANIQILIKYFCVKEYEKIDFNIVNDDGNNALMIAVMNDGISESLIQMLAEKTSDKLVVNKEGKSVLNIVQELDKQSLLPFVQ